MAKIDKTAKPTIRIDLEAKITKEESWLNLVYQGGKLIYNASTVNVPNLLDQVKNTIQEVEDFKEARAALSSEQSTAENHRDMAVFVCLGALALGDFLRRDCAKQNKPTTRLSN